MEAGEDGGSKISKTNTKRGKSMRKMYQRKICELTLVNSVTSASSQIRHFSSSEKHVLVGLVCSYTEVLLLCCGSGALTYLWWLSIVPLFVNKYSVKLLWSLWIYFSINLHQTFATNNFETNIGSCCFEIIYIHTYIFIYRYIFSRQIELN